MDLLSKRVFLEDLITSGEVADTSLLPPSLVAALKKWKWGSYGWVSPASLILTACWRKALFPDSDVCRIWASDSASKPIPNSYSIRTEDETVTIPILAKYDLCTHFCSPNSGMQGSRAVEKMRSLKRLERNLETTQRTSFGLPFLSEIFNDINDLNNRQSIASALHIINIAQKIKGKRLATEKKILSTQPKSSNKNIFEILEKAKDPELYKCVVASALECIYGDGNISGVSDHKTAADERAEKPGDLQVNLNNKVILGVEVKDPSRKIDWQNVSRAKSFVSKHDGLEGYLLVTCGVTSFSKDNYEEILSELHCGLAQKSISILSIYELVTMSKICSTKTLLNFTSKNINLAPSIKPKTTDLWLSWLAS